MVQTAPAPLNLIKCSPLAPTHDMILETSTQFSHVFRGVLLGDNRVLWYWDLQNPHCLPFTSIYKGADTAQVSWLSGFILMHSYFGFVKIHLNLIKVDR